MARKRTIGMLAAAAVGLGSFSVAGAIAAVPYPAPTAAPTTTTTTTTPTGGTGGRFSDQLELSWKWGPKVTTLVSAHLAVAGPDVTLTALYLTPGNRLAWQVTGDGPGPLTTALEQLERRSYATGAKLQLTLSVPGKLPQRSTFTFRKRKIPSVKTTYPQP